jgi:hypothetical protein
MGGLTIKTRRIALIVCILLFLVAAPAVLLYSNGYRLGSNWTLNKTGGLYVASPVSGAQIFINNKLEKETNILQSGLFLSGLKQGNYSVLVAKEEYWPWEKKMEVKNQMVTEARALLLPKDPEGEIIKRENSSPLQKTEYDDIYNNLKEVKKLSLKSTTTIERFTSQERQRLWWKPQEKNVWVEWIGEENSRPYYLKESKNLVFTSPAPIKNADFYPGRKDVIIITYQNGVFAMEIDKRGGQIKQPVYKGKDPVFITHKNTSSVFILDEDALIKIKLP